MRTSNVIDRYVLDAITMDMEQLDPIVAYLNGPDSEWQFHERPAQRFEVLAALQRMVRQRLVKVYLPPESDQGDYVECDEGVWPDRPISHLHFDVTGRGIVRYLNWDL